MADRVTAKSSDVKFTPHPAGVYVAQCVDTIDLGEAVVDYPGYPKYVALKCAVVFRTGEKNRDTGEHIDVSGEFTVSMGEKANLRKFLESWRGKPYTNDEADAGVPLDKMVGHWARLQVTHKLSGKGRPYAIIQTVMSMNAVERQQAPVFAPYERAAYWEERKKRNQEESRKFRMENGGMPAQSDEDQSQVDDADDDLESLPF